MLRCVSVVKQAKRQLGPHDPHSLGLWQVRGEKEMKALKAFFKEPHGSIFTFNKFFDLTLKECKLLQESSLSLRRV